MILVRRLLAVCALVVVAACSSSSSSSGADAQCQQVCPDVVAAHCSLGPANEAECESGCGTIRSSSCAAKWDALFSCGGAKPQLSCDPNGQPTVTGCDAQAKALYACLAAG